MLCEQNCHDTAQRSLLLSELQPIELAALHLLLLCDCAEYLLQYHRTTFCRLSSRSKAESTRAGAWFHNIDSGRGKRTYMLRAQVELTAQRQQRWLPATRRGDLPKVCAKPSCSQ